ncbi:alkylresorcinol/alkylpyrone synthase [Arboricoccus pini]|uniref:Alkylresorcinol/alkylpyrone synthase n=1 Tax=Arboricoccus pini TaxID=1963835 RepID=A0A212PZ14_9PROT|nr:type III polyketide synthase [Arboricoccus pini]SNB52260.1 alkylresorcinol/alkylpyrone synthase [Arboricoccus pini]
MAGSVGVEGEPVRLRALATAVPSHELEQSAVTSAALGIFEGALENLARLAPLFAHAGIERRYSCLPIEAHLVERGMGARNQLFIEQATELLVTATERALDEAGLAPDVIDAVVLVSSTGIATPSLDALVAERLGMRPDVERTPIFGLGCAGGVLGLARAADLARVRPGRHVLLLVVELCTLALRLRDKSKANLVACALFGDGASAAILSTGGEGPWIGVSGEHRWPDTLDVMGWRVEDDGLGVVFSINVPEIARRRMGEATADFLLRHGRSGRRSIAGSAILVGPRS